MWSIQLDRAKEKGVKLKSGDMLSTNDEKRGLSAFEKKGKWWHVRLCKL